MAIGKLPEPDMEQEEGTIFAEINITPLTDLFLVMLIIFMVSASVAVDNATQANRALSEKVAEEKRAGLKVNLPSGAALEIDPTAASLIVQISQAGKILVQDQEVSEADLDGIFQSAFVRDKNTQVVLRADMGVNHGRVVAVMERAKRVGLTRLAIATRSGG